MMASARRLPLTYNTSTYGGETRDYQDLATWEAATDNDLVTAENGEVLDCYEDDASFDDGVTIDGATTNSNYFRVIKPADGEGHDGTPNNGVFFTNTGTTSTFSMDEPYFSVQNTVAELNINSTNSRAVFYFNDDSVASAMSVVGCIVKRSVNAGTGDAVGIRTRADGSCYSIDNLILDCQNEAIWVESITGATQYFYNNTISGCAVGLFNESAVTPVDKNTILYNNTTNYSGTWTSTTKLESASDIFVDSSSNDYHLAATDDGNGTDLSSDATYAFDDDLDGETWTSSDWGRGALKYVSDTTTIAPTTVAPTTIAPTTVVPTTLTPTTLAPTTLAPTTIAPTTVAPTTLAPTTAPPTTIAPTTLAPTTLAPTTTLTTPAPTTLLTTSPPVVSVDDYEYNYSFNNGGFYNGKH